VARYDGMPTSGKISDTTAQAALSMDKTRKALKREYDEARLEIKREISKALDQYNATDAKVRKLPCQLKQLIIQIFREKKEIKMIADAKRYSQKHIQFLVRKAIDLMIGEIC
jgi:seryl-tRNA synthetase